VLVTLLNCAGHSNTTIALRATGRWPRPGGWCSSKVQQPHRPASTPSGCYGPAADVNDPHRPLCLSMVRRRSTVRFRNGAPKSQVTGWFRSWDRPFGFGSAAVASRAEPLAEFRQRLAGRGQAGAHHVRAVPQQRVLPAVPAARSPALPGWPPRSSTPVPGPGFGDGPSPSHASTVGALCTSFDERNIKRHSVASHVAAKRSHTIVRMVVSAWSAMA
jgi:hypothetical protein